MGLYKNANGVLTPIAGRGKAEYGASTVRQGTFVPSSSTAVPSLSTLQIPITFDEPMPDTDYKVIFQLIRSGALTINVRNKTVNGFTIFLFNTSSGIETVAEIEWYAFKLYTDNEYNGLLNSVNYSTTEKRIGTWIDGKPLYQLTFTMKTPSAVGSTTYNLSAYNIKLLVSEDAMLQRTGSTGFEHQVNWHYSNNNHDMTTYFAPNTGTYYIYKGAGAADMNADAYITIRYTKTTD